MKHGAARCELPHAMKHGMARCVIMCLGSTAIAAEALLPPAFNKPLEPQDIGWRWSVRPLVCVGVSTVGSYQRGEDIPWGVSAMVGGRALIGPDSEHRFGLEATWLSTGLKAEDGMRNASLLGPVAEMRVWRFVYLDVGVLYAHEIGGERGRYADVMYGFGFAPSLFGKQAKWTPSLSYRGDVIFSTHPITVRTLMLGMQYAF